MQILTSLNSMQDAEEILQWLKSHGIAATLEGQHAYNLRYYVPNRLGIYVLNAEQFQKAKLLLREFDARFTQSSKSKRSRFSRIKDKKLDKFFIAVCTVVLTIFVILLASSLIA